MKTVAIHYFTGTGNTAHAVKLITKQLKSAGLDAVGNDAAGDGAAGAGDGTGDGAGYEVTIFQVKNAETAKPHSLYDYHIFAFPVLSWAAPVIMKKYLRKMSAAPPKMTVSAGNKAAILAINGSIFHNGKLVKGYTGQALEQAESILRHKNYDVFLTANASFPDNWTQATNPCSKEDIAAIFPLGNAEVRGFTENFMNQKRELYRCGQFNKIWSHAVAGLFGLIGRRALGKFLSYSYTKNFRRYKAPE